MKTKSFVKCLVTRQQMLPAAEQSEICGLEKDHSGPHSWSDEWMMTHPYKPLLRIGDRFVLKRDWGWLKDGILYTVEDIKPGPPDGSPMYFFSKNGAMFGSVYADLVDDEIKEGFAEALYPE